uniref:Uncharacterized protein n=1 Tax=Anguilla anguilla TaxID=7936 RepID=A0A0E9WUP3_ANGAN
MGWGSLFTVYTLVLATAPSSLFWGGGRWHREQTAILTVIFFIPSLNKLFLFRLYEGRVCFLNASLTLAVKNVSMSYIALSLMVFREVFCRLMAAALP